MERKHEPEVPAILKAQAYVALNHSNDALCLLASATDDDQRAGHLDPHIRRGAQNSPIAHYLRGDALARRRQWDDAVRELNASLAIDPRHVLSLNARSIVRSFRADWGGAVADFVSASDADGAFADALAGANSLRRLAPQAGFEQ